MTPVYVQDETGTTVVFTDGTAYFMADAATGDFARVELSPLPAGAVPRRITPGARNLRDVNYYAPKA
jgi:hypothetical protein